MLLSSRIFASAMRTSANAWNSALVTAPSPAGDFVQPHLTHPIPSPQPSHPPSSFVATHLNRPRQARNGDSVNLWPDHACRFLALGILVRPVSLQRWFGNGIRLAVVAELSRKWAHRPDRIRLSVHYHLAVLDHQAHLVTTPVPPLKRQRNDVPIGTMERANPKHATAMVGQEVLFDLGCLGSFRHCLGPDAGGCREVVQAAQQIAKATDFR